MPIIKWEPLEEIERFLGEGIPVFSSLRFGWDLAVDLYEEAGNIVAEMNLPGIDPEKVSITVEGNFLRISGEREEKKEKEEKNFYSREIRRGSFERLMRLPQAVVEDKVTATYRNGVLKVVLPQKAKTEEKKVAIKVTG